MPNTIRSYLAGSNWVGRIGEAVAEDRDARVLELVEPERGIPSRPEDSAPSRRWPRRIAPGIEPHPAQDDHGEDADRLEEGERLWVDEDLLG